MHRRGTCRDHAVAERLVNLLKPERRRRKCNACAEARAMAMREVSGAHPGRFAKTAVDTPDPVRWVACSWDLLPGDDRG